MKPLDGRLFTAIVDRDLNAVRKALDAGADVNARDADGTIPLHDVCYRGHLDLVRLLLDHGADVNVRNNINQTPLDLACMRGRTDTVRLLLEKGAEVEPRNKLDRPPFHWAMRLPPSNPAREEILDLFREFHPELVMEAYCTQEQGDA